MNFPPNNSINIEALMLALAQQDEPIPEDIERSIDQLKDAAFLKGDTQASEQVREIIRQVPALDASYRAADQYLDTQHNAQHRTKALAATFPNPDRLPWIFYNQILPSHNWVNQAKSVSKQSIASNNQWRDRGNSIVSMICGSAFLGVMLAQIPGAVGGAIIGAIIGWFITEPKNASRNAR
jgi:hypothetical protein